jgi:hypothetical protein
MAPVCLVSQIIRLFPEIPVHISGLVGRAYFNRGAWLWLAMRAVLGVLLLFFSSSPLRIPGVVSAALVAAVLIISYADLQRRNERTLLHNLGLPVMLIIGISALPAILAESAIKIAQSLGR